MATVTAFIVLLAFVAGCVTLVLGVRLGHGESDLGQHLTWGVLTLVLQLFATAIAFVHARASSAQAARFREALEVASRGLDGGAEPPGRGRGAPPGA